MKQIRFDALVFVKFKIQLELKQTKLEKNRDIYLICLSYKKSNHEWITNKIGPQGSGAHYIYDGQKK